MTLPIRYGEPPSEKDCVEVGTVQVPTTFSNEPGTEGGGLGEIGFRGIYGSPIPPHRVALKAIAIAKTRGELPMSIKVPDLGTILVGTDGWEVI